MQVTRRRTAMLASLLLAACGPPQQVDAIVPTTQKCATTPAVDTAGQALLVGIGGTGDFKTVTAGTELTLQHGPQGGTHIYLDVLFHADAAGPWKITSHLARPNGSQEADTTVVSACSGWNRIDDVRFVLYAGGGDGDLDVRAVPTDGSSPELKTAPVAVSIK